MHPVIQIAAQLSLEGKQPTMALVKTRLPQALPMLEVITELKRYKASPKQYQEQVKNGATATIEKNEQQNEEKPSLQQQVDWLKRELTELKEVVANLKRRGA